MFTNYDIERLNEYLGRYARHLTIEQEESEPLGYLVEGAAKFIDFIEDRTGDEEFEKD